MIKASIYWNKTNIGNYVKYTVLRKNRKTIPCLIIYGICMLLIAIIGIVLAALSETFLPLAIVLVIAVFVLIGVFSAVLFSAVNKYTSDILSLNTDNKIDGIEISAHGFVLSFSEIRKAIIEWDMISTADFYGDCAYYTTADGLLFIIEKDNITYGSIDELKAITDEKLVKQDD